MRQGDGGRTPPSPAKNLAQCVRLFVMGSQTHFNFICDALRTNTQTDRQRDRGTDRQAGWSGRGGGDGRAYQSQINEMWVPQLLAAPTVSCQFSPVASCQLSPVCHVFAWFGSVRFGSFRLFALLVQTKQISLTLGCLACKCHFSVQITQFITFHLTRRVESNSQRVQRERYPLSLLHFPSPLSHPLYPVSFSFRSCSHCECVSNSPFWPNWQWEFLMGFSGEVLVWRK